MMAESLGTVFSERPGSIKTNAILFVCVENTFRSVLSVELFNSNSPA